MSEIKIRGLSNGAIATIDEKAKKQGLSRNEYLKVHIENLSILDSLKENDSKYTLILNKVIRVLEVNSLALKEFCEVNLIELEDVIKDEIKATHL